MHIKFPLQEDRKLSITYRVEAGCLGPNGVNYIIDFCQFAQSTLQAQNSNYIAWNIVYREDKKLAEMEYSVMGRIINHAQTEKYLAVFDTTIDAFEDDLNDQLTTLIHQFVDREDCLKDVK